MKNNKQQIETGLNINWFPGHMKKGTDEIAKTISNSDLVIEVLDARALTSSANTELLQLANNKPILRVGLKSDYSNIKVDQQNNQDILICNIKQPQFRNVIINAINKKLEHKIAAYQKKGLLKPKFCILVVGLPNIGKSSLINFLKAKNTLIVKNMPGVTKTQRMVAINETLNLIDTPGILLKHIPDITTAYKLVLINCIKKDVVTLEPVLAYGFNHYKTNHYSALMQYYQLDKVDDYYDFMQQICIKKRWLLANQELDLNRFEAQIFNDFSQAKICKTNFD